jgi:hypothetical protein
MQDMPVVYNDSPGTAHKKLDGTDDVLENYGVRASPNSRLAVNSKMAFLP